jgi:hypothetical protein
MQRQFSDSQIAVRLDDESEGLVYRLGTRVHRVKDTLTRARRNEYPIRRSDGSFVHREHLG